MRWDRSECVVRRCVTHVYYGVLLHNLAVK